ncbi:MAG: hypothetical protein QW815_07920 [Nitrososphaerota archaeon]
MSPKGSSEADVLPQLRGITSFEGGLVHEKFLKEQIKKRASILSRLTVEDIKEVAEKLGLKFKDLKVNEATEWCVVASPFKGFDVYFFLQRYSPEFEDEVQVLFLREYRELELPAEDVGHLTLLYLNFMIYTARLLGKNLPRISEYL